MGLRLPILAAAVLVTASPVQFLQSRQLAGGGFAEAGSAPSPQLTAWAALGLRAARARPGASTLGYLVSHESELSAATDLELVAMAESVLGRRPDRLLERVLRLQRPGGAIGPTVNSTIWGLLALRQAGRAAPYAAVRYLLRRQSRSGGWSWLAGGAPDSNDTAAAVEALRASRVDGAPIRRALAYLRRLRNPDRGFELTPGRGSDAQSTAWAVQAFLAAGRPVPRGALRYLQRLRRPDGSFRYSARFTTTPVWVTAQVVAALARRPFPL